MKTVTYNDISDEAYEYLISCANERPEQLKDVYASIREWVDEFPIEFRRERRKEYLLEAIKTTKHSFFEACKMVVLEQNKYDAYELSVKDNPYNAKEDLIAQIELYRQKKLAENYEKNLKRFDREAKVFTGKLEEISPERIERAREYPIEELIEVKGRMTLCPFHNDRHPSMDVKNNFYHCYTCGASGDCLDLVMHLENLTFKQAVERLSYNL